MGAFVVRLPSKARARLPLASGASKARARLGACLVLGAALAALAPACGARGPLDDTIVYVTDSGETPDAETDGQTRDAPVDAAPDVVVDAGHDATIIDCASCIFNSCSTEIAACITSPPCQQTVQCIATTCGGGTGGLDPSCLFKCASGSAQGGLQVLQIFQCITGTCGADCTALLAGLGGLGGGGGGGGRDGGGGGRRDGG
jgi:hypothetical protein